MKNTWSLHLLSFVILHGLAATAQQSFIPATFSKEPKGVFSFEKKWAYPWYIIKDDKGMFAKMLEGKITKEDTAHLYFTANCKTNVQGGYSLRYCHFIKKGGSVKLNFSDGAPAYASEFNVYVSNDRFYFKPEIIYPELSTGQEIAYKVTRAKLTLYQKGYKNSKLVSGYIDAEFIERISNTKDSIQNHKYYFRGYFKVPARI